MLVLLQILTPNPMAQRGTPATKGVLVPRSEAKVNTLPLPEGYKPELVFGPESVSRPDRNGQTFKFFRCFIRHQLPMDPDAPAGAEPAYERVHFSTPINVHMSITKKADKDYQYGLSVWLWSAGEEMTQQHAAWIAGAEKLQNELRELLLANCKAVKMPSDSSLKKIAVVRPNLDDDNEPKPGASPFVNAVVELPSTRQTKDGKTVNVPGSLFFDGAGNMIPVSSLFDKRLRGTAILEAEQVFVGKEQRSLILKVVEVQVLEVRPRGGGEATVNSRFRPVIGPNAVNVTDAHVQDPLALIGPAVKRRRITTIAEYEQEGGTVALVHDTDQQAADAEGHEVSSVADETQCHNNVGHCAEP